MIDNTNTTECMGECDYDTFQIVYAGGLPNSNLKVQLRSKHLSSVEAAILLNQIMNNQRIVKQLNHRIKFLKDFIDSDSSEKPETRKLLEELECVRSVSG